MSWLISDQVMIDLFPILTVCTIMILIGIIGTVDQYVRKKK